MTEITQVWSLQSFLHKNGAKQQRCNYKLFIPHFRSVTTTWVWVDRWLPAGRTPTLGAGSFEIFCGPELTELGADSWDLPVPSPRWVYVVAACLRAPRRSQAERPAAWQPALRQVAVTWEHRCECPRAAATAQREPPRWHAVARWHV